MGGDGFGNTGLGRRSAEGVHGGNPNVQPDYDLYKAEFSAVARLSHRTRIQAGWAIPFRGRNTGAAPAIFAALWREF
jgi:hypothetical protein